MHRFARRARLEMARGVAVGAHCGFGLGRTGTMLAAYFVLEGMCAEQAIATVRSLRLGSVETEEQKKALHDSEQWLRSGREGSAGATRSRG